MITSMIAPLQTFYNEKDEVISPEELAAGAKVAYMVWGNIRTNSDGSRKLRQVSPKGEITWIDIK